MTITLYPEPDMVLEMPAPRFLKFRRAVNRGLTTFKQSRNLRLAKAAYFKAEHAKMDKFIRNCAVNNRIETSGW